MHVRWNEKPHLEILSKAGTSSASISSASQAQTTVLIRAEKRPWVATVAIDGQGESTRQAVQRPLAWAFEADHI